MATQALKVRENPKMWRVTFARPEKRNSINAALLRELTAVIEAAEKSAECRIVVLEGEAGVFCTGMDFDEAARGAGPGSEAEDSFGEYMELLRRFSLSPRIIVSCLDGKVMAGGVGFVAASDFVIATESAEFALPEALWGLLPCCVLPYLMRRVGFQKAYTMALTTRPMTAREALACNLVDELTADLEDSLRKLGLRLNVLDDATVAELKSYARALWNLTPEMEALAVARIRHLSAQPRVQEKIRDFVVHKRYPWEA